MVSVPTALLLHDAFAGHDTGMHVEHPRRYRAIADALDDACLATGRPHINWQAATDDAILRVHDPTYLDRLTAIADAGGAWLDPDTMVAPDSLTAARLAAGAAIAATDAVMRGDVTRAFVPGRPPGHHATRDRAMGFCLLNSVAIAAAHARHTGAKRVAIVDWDVHHGNGTQAIFAADPDVWYASIHQAPLFPGTGARTDTGPGAGAGTISNSPLPPGSGDQAWLRAFDTDVAPFVARANPDLILLSAGYDAHVDDPIGGCQVTDAGVATLTAKTRELADRLCDGRLVAVLEGGYDPAALARSVIGTIRVLDGATPPS